MKTWLLWGLALLFTGILSACDSSDTDMINASDPAQEGEEETDGDYVGLSQQQAETRAFRRNQPFRYVVIDGEAQPVTQDVNPNRLNFTTERGIVIGVSRG